MKRHELSEVQWNRINTFDKECAESFSGIWSIRTGWSASLLGPIRNIMRKCIGKHKQQIFVKSLNRANNSGKHSWAAEVFGAGLCTVVPCGCNLEQLVGMVQKETRKSGVEQCGGRGNSENFV